VPRDPVPTPAQLRTLPTLRTRPTVPTATARPPAQPAAASSAVFLERPMILRPSHATGS
jgi:hypothetical protein